MPMALKRDVYVAQSKCGEAKPIDLVHLSAQTMGDEMLANEVLGIFSSQMKIQVNLVFSGTNKKSISEAAHSIKGASRGIGAFKLAAIAQEIEISGKADKNLQVELDAVVDYIQSIHN